MARPAAGAPGHDADAIVVGGGPAGAAAAARLAARGFRTVLIDRASFPRDKVCGDFVGPAALVELADLGVADAQIAAICRDSGATLASRNTPDFEETGIELIDPWKLG